MVRWKRWRGVFRMLPGIVAVTVAGCGDPASRTAVKSPTPVVDASPAASSESATAGGVEVRERTIVRKKLPKDLRSIALEYTVILLDEQNAPQPIDPAAHTFAVGDSFLVRIRPQDDLFVYVFNESPDGRRVCLLPSKDEEPQLVKAGQEINLPDDGGYFTFEPPAGEEKLVVVAAPDPIEDLRLLAAAAFRGNTSVSSSTGGEKLDAISAIRERSGDAIRTRGPIRKVVERIESQGGTVGRMSHVEPPVGGESSTYGIAISGADGTPELILDIPLRSKEADGE